MANAVEQNMSDASLIKATGKGWEEWYEILDLGGVKQMPHNEIVQWLYDNSYITEFSWGQYVTIGYEKYIGRRVTGQNCYGEFVVGCSKTLSGTLDSVHEQWCRHVQNITRFDDTNLAGQPKISATEKWRYWRASLEDGSKISVNISQKGNNKITLTIDHSNVAGNEARGVWKAYWKELLTGI